MTKVTTHLGGIALDTLRKAPGQTDGEKVRWLINFFGATLEAKEYSERVARLRQPEDEPEESGPRLVMA